MDSGWYNGFIKHSFKVEITMASRIHIKPSRRGSFTRWCKQHGESGVTPSCIAKGKRSKSSAIRKKATFAANARKWNHRGRKRR